MARRHSPTVSLEIKHPCSISSSHATRFHFDLLPLELAILCKILATCRVITLSAVRYTQVYLTFLSKMQKCLEKLFFSTITSVCFGLQTVKAIKDSISYLKCVLLVINQTQKTVFDHVFKLREERCNTARSGVMIFDERILRCLEMWSNTVSSVDISLQSISILAKSEPGAQA